MPEEKSCNVMRGPEDLGSSASPVLQHCMGPFKIVRGGAGTPESVVKRNRPPVLGHSFYCCRVMHHAASARVFWDTALVASGPSIVQPQ